MSFGDLTSSQARRLKNAQSDIVETVAQIKNHGWQLEEEHAEALELQALRMVLLDMVKENLIDMEELNIRIVEQKAAELGRQFQERCTKKAEERASNILVLPKLIRNA